MSSEFTESFEGFIANLEARGIDPGAYIASLKVVTPQFLTKKFGIGQNVLCSRGEFYMKLPDNTQGVVRFAPNPTIDTYTVYVGVANHGTYNGTIVREYLWVVAQHVHYKSTWYSED